MCTLRGRAWDACEDIPMDQLEGSGSMKAVLDRLDKVFKFDAITELPNDFETFFVTLARRKGSTLQEYSGDFERALRKLGQHGVDLPDKVVGWYYLRRAGLSQNQRQMVLSSIGTETLSLENVRRVMNFVIGQDSVPDGGVDHRSKMNRWKSPFPMKESIYFEEDELVDDYQDWEDDMAIMFADADQFWGSKEAEDPEEFEEFDDEVNIVSDDMAAEYDDILAGYTEARQRLNALRMSRGYYPVVAMVPDGASGKGSNYSVNKGKGKSKKGKGGGGKQSPKAPSAKARGRAALGADKCLRCGQAGHRARNCPAAGKRKADTSVEADVNMVADSDEVQLVAPESDIQDDIAMMDCGAGSVLTSEERLKTYLRFLETSGFDVNAIPVFRCKKGFKFGNGEKNITSVCVLVPTFMEGQRRDILMYVIPGSAPVLFGRPLMEALDISINYSSGKVKWGKKAWKQSPRGSRGEFICHMAADLPRLAKKEPAKVLLPDDFEQHVHPELLSIDVFFNGKAEDMLNVAEDAVNSVTEAASFSSAAGYGLQKVHEACEKCAILPHHGGTMPPNSSPEFQSAMLSSDDDDVVLQELTDPGADATESVASPTENREALHRLPAGKLRQLLYDTEARIKEFDAILQATQVKGAKKKFKVWEVFAGEGRVTKTANRREKLEAERFSLVEGWDFADAKHRMAFLRQLRREDPDVVLLSPMCKLWSQLQELNIAAHPGYAEKLNEQRIWDHDDILMFCAIVYEHQRRRKKIATCEHPQKSRAWQTQAFETMQGWDAHIDQCMFGLRLPNEENVMLPVQKPTTFRVTSETLQKRLERRCNGKHKHTHLEGSIPGVGLRSWLAESYPQLLATHIVDCILQELESPDYNYILATEEVPEPLDGENTRLEEPQHAAEVKDKDLQLESSQFQDLDPVRRNRVLRAQVGPRAVEYVQRLHKNLGHPGWEVLYRMLQEVQATDNVLQAAKFYTCPLCYARKPPKQSPPASGLKCTEFNDRILVDSHWIACEESIVKEREPAPGTPAARRKAKDKKEKRPTGRQCVLTIIDHATRYCSIRILKSERADEFTKGLERSWIKHFGMPKILRIDEAKGWSSEHVRNWATQRGITLEVQPAENHTWLGVVERKHQVIRRALELYMDQNDNHGLATLKEAVYYVPHSINQLSFHKGFTPQQWVLGKSMTYVHGLSGEFFNPAQEAIDEQGHFAQVQERRARAARAFIAADSDAKLRRAFNQKFAEMQEELVIGQKACATALEELMMVKTFLQVLKKPQKSLKELKDQLDGEDCAMVTDCKALFDAIHRETIQQATDKRVAIEGLVIKDLLHDLRCQWRWVSSERQLSDGLTKIGARQSFVERYKGSHVQLVADHAFTAAKKKSKEQRAQTVAETRSSTRSEVANTLIAMVMATCIQESHGAKDRQEDGSWLGFDGALMVTALIGLLTMLWFFFEAVNRCCRQTKAKEVELEDEEEIPREKTWPASRKKNKMPESQDDEEDIIYLCKKHPAVKEVYDQVEYLRSELMRANEKVCAERTFYAHRIVLAAESEVFKSGLATVTKEANDGRQEIRLAEISNPEAVKFMLDYMYQTDAAEWADYNPRTQDAPGSGHNGGVLCLSVIGFANRASRRSTRTCFD
eukprot:g28916.t1